MDPSRRSTKAVEGMLYALVILLVLAIIVQGHTKNLEQIAAAMRGICSHNSSPASSLRTPAAPVHFTARYDELRLLEPRTSPDALSSGENVLRNYAIGLVPDELKPIDTVHMATRGARRSDTRDGEPQSPIPRTP